MGLVFQITENSSEIWWSYSETAI